MSCFRRAPREKQKVAFVKGDARSSTMRSPYFFALAASLAACGGVVHPPPPPQQTPPEQTVPEQTVEVEGQLDVIDADAVAAGWALSPKAATTAVAVALYADGDEASGTLLATT